MKPFAVINDLHIGVVRAAGTTPNTAYALRQWIIQRLAELLLQASDCDLLVNGDLFDSEHIPYSDLLETYRMFAQWMIDNPESILYLPPGNHDLSRTTTTMSSQQFFTMLLVGMFGERRVVVPTQGMAMTVAGDPGWVIPHMPNQELFDLELAKVPAVKYLFLHCNFDNKFAVQSDHSLNLSKEQAQGLKVERIVLGHEHQRKMALTGKVMIPGNQFPSSVADCLGNHNKMMTMIRPASDPVPFEMLETWTEDGSFCKANWRELSEVSPEAQFVRVEGEAATSEAPAVLTAISKLRKSHNAFVITNAVAIEGRVIGETVQNMEKVANFNVVQALMQLLVKYPTWTAKVKDIMEKNNVNAA